MTARCLDFHRDRLTDDLSQFSGRSDRCLLSGSHNVFRYILCKFIFTVITNDPVQFSFFVTIDNISGGTTLPLIHSHIQRCVGAIGKSSLLIVQLIR